MRLPSPSCIKSTCRVLAMIVFTSSIDLGCLTGPRATQQTSKTTQEIPADPCTMLASALLDRGVRNRMIPQ